MTVADLTFAEAKLHCLPYTHRMKRQSDPCWVTCWACGADFKICHYRYERSSSHPKWQHSDHIATDWIVEQLPTPFWANPFKLDREKIWSDFIQYRKDTGVLTNDLICDFIRFEVKFGLREPSK